MLGKDHQCSRGIALWERSIWAHVTGQPSFAVGHESLDGFLVLRDVRQEPQNRSVMKSFSFRLVRAKGCCGIFRLNLSNALRRPSSKNVLGLGAQDILEPVGTPSKRHGLRPPITCGHQAFRADHKVIRRSKTCIEQRLRVRTDRQTFSDG